MNFSVEYLYDNFKKCYDGALSAKNAGNLPLAKEKLGQAADYMERLAMVSTGEYKEKNYSTAKRLRALADSITVPADMSENGFTGASPVAANPSDKSATYADTSYSQTDGGTGMEQFFTLIDRNGLEGGFESVVGLDDAKRAVTEYIINPVRYPEAYNYNFLDNKAILLEGPPGTGKTTFAKAVAKEVDLPFALINVSALVNCYVGETSKNIDKVFAYLREYARKKGTSVIIFFDEFDEIAKRRGGDDKASEASVPALLRNLDGVKKNEGFLILANTNCRNLLDPAIAERFRKLIHIPLPDSDMREKLFRKKLCEVEEEFLSKIDWAEMSGLSEGLSGRDITFICDDFKRELSKIKAGLSSDGDVNGILTNLVKERIQSKNTEV